MVTTFLAAGSEIEKILDALDELLRPHFEVMTGELIERGKLGQSRHAKGVIGTHCQKEEANVSSGQPIPRMWALWLNGPRRDSAHLRRQREWM